MSLINGGTSFTGTTLASFRSPKSQSRCFKLRVVAKDSRIGKRPVALPDKVQVTLEGNTVKVKGPNGELQRTLPNLVTVELVDNTVKVAVARQGRLGNQQHGLSRTLVANMVEGVSAGFTKTLSLVGVGYRAAVAGSTLTLNLGYSHPVEMAIPSGLSVKVEKNTSISILGRDKEAVGQFAADVRSKRPPEPYKGKGVRYADEHVARKEGKRGK